MSKKFEKLSSFAAWLVKLVDERKTTITAIANNAGLAPGTLRYLLLEPERRPSIETCLRLSEYSGRPVDELLALANQKPSQPVDPYHPDRMKIMSIFDSLPSSGRRVLLNVAELIGDFVDGNDAKDVEN